MSIENVTTALQAFATTGDGFTLTLPDARFVTFNVQGVGPVTAAQVTIERASNPFQGGNTPMLSSGWTALTTIPAPANATTDEVTTPLLAEHEEEGEVGGEPIPPDPADRSKDFALCYDACLKEIPDFLLTIASAVCGGCTATIIS
jgi:hypothetical protein